MSIWDTVDPKIFEKRAEFEIRNVSPLREDLKWDEGKLKHSLIRPEFLELMAEILTKGEINHPAIDGQPSWQFVEPEAYVDAMMRHINDWRKGEKSDKDMKTNHMGHIAVNAMFLHYFDTKGE